MKNTDEADDLEFLVTTPAQAETLLHNLMKAAKDIGLCVNANKTEFMCFKQEGSTLRSNPLKLVD